MNDQPTSHPKKPPKAAAQPSSSDSLLEGGAVALGWFLVADSGQRLSIDEQKQAAQTAFSMWAESGLVRFFETEKAEKAEILIAFDLGPMPMTDRRPLGIRAQRTPGPGGKGERIWLDPTEKWTMGRPSRFADDAHLPTTLAHEIGHALGLEHWRAGKGSSIMASPPPAFVERIGADDFERLRKKMELKKRAEGGSQRASNA